MSIHRIVTIKFRQFEVALDMDARTRSQTIVDDELVTNAGSRSTIVRPSPRIDLFPKRHSRRSSIFHGQTNRYTKPS